MRFNELFPGSSVIIHAASLPLACRYSAVAAWESGQVFLTARSFSRSAQLFSILLPHDSIGFEHPAALARAFHYLADCLGDLLPARIFSCKRTHTPPGRGPLTVEQRVVLKHLPCQSHYGTARGDAKRCPTAFSGRFSDANSRPVFSTGYYGCCFLTTNVVEEDEL